MIRWSWWIRLHRCQWYFISVMWDFYACRWG